MRGRSLDPSSTGDLSLVGLNQGEGCEVVGGSNRLCFIKPGSCLHVLDFKTFTKTYKVSLASPA